MSVLSILREIIIDAEDAGREAADLYVQRLLGAL